MSKGNIKINVSGGNANFGNISQGDSNTLESSQNISIEATDLEVFYSALQKISRKKNVSDEQLESLRQEVAALSEKVADNDVVAKIKALYEKYDWAIKPLEKLLSVIMP